MRRIIASCLAGALLLAPLYAHAATTLLDQAQRVDPMVRATTFHALQRALSSRVQHAMETRFPGETPTISYLSVSSDSGASSDTKICFDAKTQSTPEAIYALDFTSDDITVLDTPDAGRSYCMKQHTVVLMAHGHF